MTFTTVSSPIEQAPGKRSLRIVSLFSGIGGLDFGLENAGHQIIEMCESWTPARRVLAEKFPNVPVARDVRAFHSSTNYDLLTAGFPCVDISHAGGQRGIFGPQSGLVEHAFRVIGEDQPEWVVLENVPNILRLGKGVGIAHVLDSLVGLGYSWAYRVVDSRSAGVAQSRRRVIVLASRSEDPAAYLLAEEAGDTEPEAESDDQAARAWGFYWTEGRRGVGLVEGAIPTLKGGSTLGLPSAPAIWNPRAPNGMRISLPTIEDGEELQGFERGWTASATASGEPNHRWKLVGNAVTVGIASWVGRSLAESIGRKWEPVVRKPLDRGRPWPDAAWGGSGGEWSSTASAWPMRNPIRSLAEVISESATTPLSHRATAGFMSRLAESGIKIDRRLTTDLESHLASMRSVLPPERTRPDSWASNPDVRKRMQGVKSKNTGLEMALRRELSNRGLRYRLQRRPEADLRWRSDFVFIGPKVIVDVRGCYWHACPAHSTVPKVNTERWEEKFAATRARDERMVTELTERGWLVVVVWGHENPGIAAEAVMALVNSRRKSHRSTASNG